ncbi:MAG: DUF1838 family protein [Chromatiales bacterium]|nr:DUF1838 family protein [Chromatiales bacterium]
MDGTREAGLTRRLVLKLAAGSLALPAIAGAADSDALAAANQPDNLLRAWRRLRYAEGDTLAFWWMRATKYGLVDNRLTPLFGMEIGNIARTHDVPGGFAGTSLEMVFFTDLGTGRRTEVVVNPYTGESLPRKDSLVGPTTITYRDSGTEYPSGLPGVKLEIEPLTKVFAVEGDDVWIRDDTTARVTPLAEGAPRFWVSDWSTYQGSRAALADPALKSVPGHVTFNSVSSWLDWMKMGDRPGYMLSRGSGRKFARFDELPESFLDIVRERYPAILKDPGGALERPAYTFAP